MKKLIALMVACLLLAAMPALAEEPTIHTFMGIPWDAAQDEAVRTLIMKTGAGVYWSDRHPEDVYLQKGFYKMLGMQLSEDGLCMSFDPDSGLLSSVSCQSIEYPLRRNETTDEMNLDDLSAGNEVVRQLIGRYGVPDIACVYIDTLYLVAEEELPFIVRDAAHLTRLCGKSRCDIMLVFGNVAVEVSIEVPGTFDQEYRQGCYSIVIRYLPEPLRPEEVSYLLLEPARLRNIPILNGEIQFIVIDP